MIGDLSENKKGTEKPAIWFRYIVHGIAFKKGFLRWKRFYCQCLQSFSSKAELLEHIKSAQPAGKEK